MKRPFFEVQRSNARSNEIRIQVDGVTFPAVKIMFGERGFAASVRSRDDLDGFRTADGSLLESQAHSTSFSLKFGAQDWTRTSMLLALAPETSASTNSATWAHRVWGDR